MVWSTRYCFKSIEKRKNELKKKKRQIQALGLFLILGLPNTANAARRAVAAPEAEECVEEVGRTETSMLKLKADC